MANEIKRQRRIKMGDKDPTQTFSSGDKTSGIPAQPNPNLPQGAGNLMNNPMNAQSMGGGAPQPGGPGLYPYMDGGIGNNDGRLGTVGFAPRSNVPENIVPGRKLNSQAYGTIAQPKEGMSQEMLYPMSQAQSAANHGGADNPMMKVGPLGPMGYPIEDILAGGTNPGQIAPTLMGQTPTSMPLVTGTETQTLAQNGRPAPSENKPRGMNTGRGGGRNQTA